MCRVKLKSEMMNHHLFDNVSDYDTSERRPPKRRKINARAGKNDNGPGWDPNYPISSKLSNFATIGAILLRCVPHPAFQDGVLAISLQYVGLSTPGTYTAEWDEGRYFPHTEIRGFPNFTDALREALVRTPDLKLDKYMYIRRYLHGHEDDPAEEDEKLAITFLELNHHQRRMFLNPLTEDQLVHLEDAIYKIMDEYSDVDQVIRVRTILRDDHE